MATRIIGALALLGGLAFGGMVAFWSIAVRQDSDIRPWELPGGVVGQLIVLAGILALGLSLGGLAYILFNHYETPVGLVAVLGACSGILTALRAPSALVMLPLTSAAVLVYLARIRAVHRWLAALHVASAPGLLVGFAAYSDRSLLGVAIPWILAYCLTWIGIGLELMRWVPQPRPSGPTATGTPS